ncbi:MAG: FAD-dependent oxidoreductase, partial [Thermodesulfobacteriota bacterium]
QGHQPVVYDTEKELGGKMSAVIPASRIPKEVLVTELDRIREVVEQVNLSQSLNKKEVQQLRDDYDFVILAAGAWKPRTLPVPGRQRLVPALDFLAQAAVGDIQPGKRIVVIGAGNVGCDVATEAHRLGAGDITLIDVQQPASFGKERSDAEAVGAKFRWPCFTREITAEGVVLQSGELLPADTVVVSIGDAPDTAFLPDDINTASGFVTVNDIYQTSDERVFAVGDLVKPGLLTDAIGSGRKAAAAINTLIAGKTPAPEGRRMIDKSRISLAYFDRRLTGFADTDQCSRECASCGTCRDCGICVAICPRAAISRQETDDETGYAYVVDGERCIGCGFCAGACPCGIWCLVGNEPLEGEFSYPRGS